MKECLYHLDFLGAVCPDCGLEVDQYGNTEDSFKYCCFPDCGCDGARLCMAPSGASSLSMDGNTEGMYQMKGHEGQVARTKFLMAISRKNNGELS